MSYQNNGNASYEVCPTCGASFGFCHCGTGAGWPYPGSPSWPLPSPPPFIPDPLPPRFPGFYPVPDIERRIKQLEREVQILRQQIKNKRRS